MIVIYGKESCPFCVKAKDLCEQYNFQYEYISVEDQNNLAELKEKVPEAKTVPQIFWHGKHIGGYNEFAIEVENTRNFGQDSF